MSFLNDQTFLPPLQKTESNWWVPSPDLNELFWNLDIPFELSPEAEQETPSYSSESSSSELSPLSFTSSPKSLLSSDSSNGSRKIEKKKRSEANKRSTRAKKQKETKKVPLNEEIPEEKIKKRRQRFAWTPEIHQLFIEALEKLGDRAIPSDILKVMKVKGLTRCVVASHLQKYRLHLTKNKELVDPKNDPLRSPTDEFFSFISKETPPQIICPNLPCQCNKKAIQMVSHEPQSIQGQITFQQIKKPLFPCIHLTEQL